MPSKAAWGDIGKDLDVKYAYKIFGEKERNEVHGDFGRCVIERADELRFMPDAVFPYYMLAFMDFVEHGEYSVADASDVFHSYLELIKSRLKSSPQSIIIIIKDLAPSIRRIILAQDHFNISREIYGNFEEYESSIFGAIRKHDPSFSI